MNPTQSQYNVTMQSYRDVNIKITVKDKKLNIIDEISGIVTDGNIDINADSDIRRTANITMLLESPFTRTEVGGLKPEQSVYWRSGNVYWFFKFIQIEIGITDVLTGEVVWINQGNYMINTPSVDYDAESNILSFEAVDMMGYLTGLRNGQLEGVEYIIPQGSKIVEVMESLLRQAGIDKYILYTPETPNLPYEIKADVGSTVYDLLAQLRDVNSNWEMFFDEEGTFIFQKIPNGVVSFENQGIVTRAMSQPYVTDVEFNKLLISWNLDTNFEEVKNYIEVIGKTHDISTLDSSPKIDGKLITLNFPTLDLTPTPPKINGENTSKLIWLVGFTVGDLTKDQEPIPTTEQMDTITLITKGSQTNNIKLVDTSNNPTSITTKNKTYVLRITKTYDYLTQNTSFTYEFLGGIQAFGVAYDNNPNSPFYVGENFENRVRLVCNGDEYDNIYSDDLATQRARYEVYLHARLNDSMNIVCVPIYWLGVNELIQFNPPSGVNQDEHIDYYWIVKSISIDFSIEGTQSINAMRYYPEFPS